LSYWPVWFVRWSGKPPDENPWYIEFGLFHPWRYFTCKLPPYLGVKRFEK